VKQVTWKMLEFFLTTNILGSESKEWILLPSQLICVQINFFQMLATVVGIIHQRFCQEWVWSLIHDRNGRNSLFQEKSRFGLECSESSKVHTYLVTRMFRDI